MVATITNVTIYLLFTMFIFVSKITYAAIVILVTTVTKVTNVHWLFKVKVKCSRYRPVVAQRVGRGIALLFHDRSTRRGWVVSSTPRPHLTPGKDPVPIVQEAEWALGAVWTGAESLVPTGIWSRTVQPVVSRYTDWATRPTIGCYAYANVPEVFRCADVSCLVYSRFL